MWYLEHCWLPSPTKTDSMERSSCGWSHWAWTGSSYFHSYWTKEFHFETHSEWMDHGSEGDWERAEVLKDRKGCVKVCRCANSKLELTQQIALEADFLHIDPSGLGVCLLVDFPRFSQHPTSFHVGPPILVEEIDDCSQDLTVGQDDLLLQLTGFIILKASARDTINPEQDWPNAQSRRFIVLKIP